MILVVPFRGSMVWSLTISYFHSSCQRQLHELQMTFYFSLQQHVYSLIYQILCLITWYLKTIDILSSPQQSSNSNVTPLVDNVTPLLGWHSLFSTPSFLSKKSRLMISSCCYSMYVSVHTFLCLNQMADFN